MDSGDGFVCGKKAAFWLLLGAVLVYAATSLIVVSLCSCITDRLQEGFSSRVKGSLRSGDVKHGNIPRAARLCIENRGI